MAGSAPAAAAASGGATTAAAAPLPQWTPTQEQMNRALLTSRDPILLFADLPLFESELEDHGASQVSVKVRAVHAAHAGPAGSAQAGSAWAGCARALYRAQAGAVEHVLAPSGSTGGVLRRPNAPCRL